MATFLRHLQKLTILWSYACILEKSQQKHISNINGTDFTVHIEMSFLKNIKTNQKIWIKKTEHYNINTL